MIEILQFALSTNLGGIETYLKKIWDNIDRDKFHFSFVDMTGDGNIPCYYEYFTKSGCPFYKITPRNTSPWKNRREFVELFNNHHFDILHFSVNTLSYMLPVLIALKAETKVIVHSRCSAFPDSKVTEFLHQINRVRLKKLPVERIAISDQAGTWMFKDLNYKVFPNGVDTSRFYFDYHRRKAIREDLGCYNKKVIGHVGTFIPTKNHDFIIKVFEEYHRRHKESSLWLIGEGPEKERIKELVHSKNLDDSVLFLGRRNDVENLYAGMDLFIFPSIYEGLGNVILEAEAEGLPCLISDNIPQETLVLENAQSLNITASIEKWCEKIEYLLCYKVNREEGVHVIEATGWSTRDEIIRLQNLYESMC